MSLAAFRSKLHLAHYGENDQVWFPKWLARYAAGKPLTTGLLPVTESLVTEFSRSLMKSGAPAWQRLQCVRAVEAYRNLVLNVSEPDLTAMKQILGRLAATEKDSVTAAGSPEITEGSPIRPSLKSHVAGKQLVMSQTAVNELQVNLRSAAVVV